MRLRSDEGVELDAEYSVMPDGEHLGVVLENGQPALPILLDRLRNRHAVLHLAVAALPEQTLVREPIALDGMTDETELWRELIRVEGRVQLRLAVPGYGPEDARRLAADLAGPAVPAALPTAYDLLVSLLHQEVRTITGQRNTVLKVDRDAALVGTDRSPGGKPVEVRRVQRGLDILAARGSVVVQPHELGHRSSFVGAVLATLPDAQVTDDPPTIALGVPSAAEIAANPHFGSLDGRAEVKIRKEQGQLRALLAGGRKSAPCALCGHPYPIDFLVAAHVKKRAVCTDAERLDLHNVAMLACLFGCDALYEGGWITVDENGLVRVRDEAGELGDRVADLDGLRCGAHGPGSEPYFAWHRVTVFPKRPDTD